MKDRLVDKLGVVKTGLEVFGIEKRITLLENKPVILQGRGGGGGSSDISGLLKIDQTTPQTTVGDFGFDSVTLGTDRCVQASALSGVFSLADLCDGGANHTLNIDLASDASWIKFTADNDLDFDALALKTSKNIRILNSAFFDGEKKFGYLGVGWLTGWTYRIKATFSASTTVIPESATKFPALITRSSHAHIKANALSTGNDLRITMADGVTLLPIEKSLYDSSTGGFDIWFKMPVLNTSKIVYLYYGNASATNVNSTEVWGNGELGVWHLNEASGNALDSLGVYNGTAVGASLTRQVAGKFGKATQFPGSSSGYFDLGDVLDQDVPITLSAWHKTSSNAPMWSFAKSSDSSDLAQYAGLYYNTNRVPSVFANSKSTSTDNNLSALTTPASGDWAYIVATLTNGANGMKIYVNGELSNQVAPSATLIRLTATGSFYIGRPGYNNHYWNGSLQEVRMSSVIKSANLIKTEFNMMNDNGSFVTLSDPETTTESGYLGGFYDVNTGRVGFGGIDELAKVQISPTTTTEIGLYSKSRLNFTGDLAEWATYLDVINTKIDYQGILRANYIKPIADGTTALRVQNSAGTVDLININTAGTTSFNSSGSVSFNVTSGVNPSDGAYAQFIGESEVAFNWFARENLAGKKSIRWISIDQFIRIDLLADDGGSILTSGIFNVSFSAGANSFYISSTSLVGIGTSSPVEKLTVNGNIQVGKGEAGTDYYIKFDGETNDGILTYMEDEDELRFDGTFRANAYQSSDGTAGMTGTVASPTSITIKNGLVTACS